MQLVSVLFRCLLQRGGAEVAEIVELRGRAGKLNLNLIQYNIVFFSQLHKSVRVCNSKTEVQ